MNKRLPVNTLAPKGALLERALLDKLREILGGIGWLSERQSRRPARSGGPDATILVASETGDRVALLVHFKSEIRPGTFPAWAAARWPNVPKRPAVPVLATPFVSMRLAERCRQERWSWLDLAGNCWLDVPGHLHIERTGRPAVHRRPPPRGESEYAQGRASHQSVAQPRTCRTNMDAASSGE